MLFVLSSLFLGGGKVLAQDYPISMYNGQTISGCSGTFLDAGAYFSGYTYNEDYTISFCSSDPQNTHIKLYFSTFNVHWSDTLYLYDGPSTSAPLIGAFNNNNSPFLQPYLAGITNSSGCITARFVSNSANNSSGWEASISCNTVCQEIIAVYDSVGGSHISNDSGYLDICDGESITFSGYGVYPYNNMTYDQADSLSLFIWEFSDGSSDTGKVVTHTFAQPRGYDVNLRITDDHGCTSSNSIGIRVRTSGNPLRRINPLPDICLGDTLNLKMGDAWNDHLIVKPIHHKQTASLRYDSVTFIPDGGASGGQCYTASVTFNLFDPSQTVLDSADILAVRMNAEHSWVGDLKISLVCPSGQTVILKDYIQTGNAHFGQPNTNDCLLPWCVNQANMNPPGNGWTYTWSMAAVKNVMNDYVNTGKLDSTSYLPEQSFADFSGCPLNGTWTLEVCDYWNHDNGYVFWWGLEINPLRIPEAWEYNVGIDSMKFSGNSIISQSDSSLSVAPLPSGNHPYTLNIWDDFGCSYDTSFLVHVNPNPHAGLAEDTLFCSGAPLPILEARDQGPGAAYAWMQNGNLLASGISFQPPSAGVYELQLIDSNACRGTDTISVSEAIKPLWTTRTDPASCGESNGSAEIIGSSSGLTIIWNGLPPLAGPLLTNAYPGWHAYLLNDGLCTYTDSIYIEHIAPPKYSVLNIEEENCAKKNGSILLSVGGGKPPYFIEWMTDPPQSGLYASDLSSGIISFKINDSICEIIDSLMLDMIPGAKAAFGFLPAAAELPDAVYRFRDESDAGVISWYWDFGDGGSSIEKNPVHNYTLADSFLVRLFTNDTAGCADSAFAKVSVRDFITIYIPNAFTPNADGLNDIFGPVGHNIEIESYSMEIYDRWGRQVFITQNMLESWNGRFHNQGEMVPAGAYVYRILLKAAHRPLQQFKGSVTLY